MPRSRRPIRLIALTAALLCSSPAIAGADAPAAASSDASPANTPRPCRSFAAADFTEFNEIASRHIPDRDAHRGEEIQRVADEIRVARDLEKDWDSLDANYQNQCHAYHARDKDYRAVIAAANALAETTDCPQFKEALAKLNLAVHRLPQDWTIEAIQSRVSDWVNTTSAADFCTATPPESKPGAILEPRSSRADEMSRVRSASAAIAARFIGMLESLSGEFAGQTRAHTATARRRFSGEHLAEYQRRLHDAQAKDANTMLADKTVGKLPWIIVILGVFCLSIMVMVRRFEPEVQLLWVNSGQVIQFMTVTIIIIVVLALGLSANLHEESLGTLLGTIGGYILSNGVARSTAATRDGAPQPNKDKPT